MILDKRLEFFSKAAAAKAAGAALLGDVIDLSALGNGSLGQEGDVGQGQPLYWYVHALADVITAGTAGSVTFALTTSTAPDLSGGTAVASVTVNTGGAGATAAKSGKPLAMLALPIEGVAYKRYLGVVYTVTTTATSAGQISSGLTLDPVGARAYKGA